MRVEIRVFGLQEPTPYTLHPTGQKRSSWFAKVFAQGLRVQGLGLGLMAYLADQMTPKIGVMCAMLA